MGELLGEGRFSRVYLGVRTRDSSGEAGGEVGGEVALKELERGVLSEDEEAVEMLEAEVRARVSVRVKGLEVRVRVLGLG